MGRSWVRGSDGRTFAGICLSNVVGIISQKVLGAGE